MKKERAVALNSAMIALSISCIIALVLTYLDRPLTVLSYNLPVYINNIGFFNNVTLPSLPRFWLPIIATLATFQYSYLRLLTKRTTDNNYVYLGLIGGFILSIIFMFFPISFFGIIGGLGLGGAIIFFSIANPKVDASFILIGRYLSTITGCFTVFFSSLINSPLGLGDAFLYVLVCALVIDFASALVMAPLSFLVAIVERIFAIAKTPEAKGEVRTT